MITITEKIMGFFCHAAAVPSPSPPLQDGPFESVAILFK